MAKFTRRHYEAVAAILSEHVGVERYVDCDATLDMLSDLIRDFSKLFAKDNENFDPEKFTEACQNRE